MLPTLIKPDLGLRCLHMPDDTFLHGAAYTIINLLPMCSCLWIFSSTAVANDLLQLVWVHMNLPT